MMLGLRHEFAYAECLSCQCLQLQMAPDDLSLYYPREYYSFRKPDPAGFGVAPDRLRSSIAFYLGGYGPRLDSRILDVGSGSGSLLDALARAGFRNCLGIDPYIAEESQQPRVRKAHIAEMEPEWDVIFFNHSFEHVNDPLDALRNVARLLSPSGVCVIRMPAIPCYAWRHYGVDWVQLDAPRHLFIHSPKSLAFLAEAAGLAHTETRYDSTGFQFWGSELYRKDIALTGAKPTAFFPDAQLLEFERHARELNRERQGDQAAFYLCRRQ